jgi:phosphatidylserine decarboxylase
MWRIHPVGKNLVSMMGISSFGLIVLSYFLLPPWPSVVAMIFFFSFYLLVRYFFRYPERVIVKNLDSRNVISPADGVIVVNEMVDMDVFPEGKARQISIFMRLWDVHLNYVPVEGQIMQVRHFKGKHLAAFLPKSSLDNEHVDYFIKTSSGIILVREIAGLIARRIVPLVHENESHKAGDELGFIKFGSRVDIFLPPLSEVQVQQGQIVKGGLTQLAILPLSSEKF